jgi:hypothetical protein
MSIQLFIIYIYPHLYPSNNISYVFVESYNINIEDVFILLIVSRNQAYGSPCVKCEE